MASFHNNVSLDGYHFEKFILTFKLAAGIVAADVGKPVSLDTSAPNQVKIAADGDAILGVLATVDLPHRSTGAVELKFAQRLKIKAADTIAVGDTAVGAGGGEVKKAASANHSVNFVAEIRDGYAVVVKV